MPCDHIAAYLNPAEQFYQSMSTDNIATPRQRGRYFTTRDLALVGTFAAVQFVLQHATGQLLTFLPGAERSVVAFPVGFVAAITYIITKKPGTVGLTILITGLIQLALSGFYAVIFEFIGGAVGAEIVVFLAQARNRRLGKWGIGLMAGALMLGRGIGVTIGLLIFVPVIVFHNIGATTLLAIYLVFNALLPFLIGMTGALAAVQLAKSGRFGQQVNYHDLKAQSEKRYD